MQLQAKAFGENRTHDPTNLVRRSANWATKAIVIVFVIIQIVDFVSALLGRLFLRYKKILHATGFSEGQKEGETWSMD